MKLLYSRTTGTTVAPLGPDGEMYDFYPLIEFLRKDIRDELPMYAKLFILSSVGYWWMHLTESSKVISEHKTIFYLLNISEVLIALLILLLIFFLYAIIAILYAWGYKMKLILDTENSHPATIIVKGKEIMLLLIESNMLIDSSQIAKIFDKKEKTVATKV